MATLNLSERVYCADVVSTDVHLSGVKCAHSQITVTYTRIGSKYSE